MSNIADASVAEAPKPKTVITVNLGANFDTLNEALAFVETVKDAGLTRFDISQYEQYEDYDRPY